MAIWMEDGKCDMDDGKCNIDDGGGPKVRRPMTEGRQRSKKNFLNDLNFLMVKNLCAFVPWWLMMEDVICKNG
ncbi:hypothetical protein DRW42_07565 [Pedobacter miscanthi]|uniref:Uncharacterized protein n=1 Tax=Pedobacter miscanthi TaxID=2259170 RepID=A0A366L5A2_9SPHI|nr:hypothetical protein DRW42_07565 [Pedobacter miscanthi]